DRNGVSDVFVMNRRSNVVEVVSLDRTGQATGDGASWEPSISADGRRVAFTSLAGNLVEGDDNGLPDVFLRDLTAGTTILVSRGADGRSRIAESGRPMVSPDGLWVAFESRGTRLLEDATATVEE